MTNDQVLARIHKELARQAKGLKPRMVCYANGLAKELELSTRLNGQPSLQALFRFHKACKHYVFEHNGEQHVCCIIANTSTLNCELWLGEYPTYDTTSQPNQDEQVHETQQS